MGPKLIVGALLLIATSRAGAQTVFFNLGGNAPGDSFGRSISEAGDVNADGYADVIIGAPLDETSCTDNGVARVYSGKDGSMLYAFVGGQAFDYFSYAVGGGGDVNQDGFADLVVGGPQIVTGSVGFKGYACVFSGADGTVLYTWGGEGAGDTFGLSVANAQDVNADGFDDVIVGAPGSDLNGVDSGAAYVFSGKDGSHLYAFRGQAGDSLGYSVRCALDVNRDLYADVIVGAPWSDAGLPDGGAAVVFSGFDGSVLYKFTGQPKSLFGWSVAGAGDTDGDLFPDLLVGAPGVGPAGPAAGQAFLFSGQDGSQLFTIPGNAQGDMLGYSVSGAADIDGDRLCDFMIGAPGAPNGTKRGHAQVIAGSTWTNLYDLDGPPGAGRFGHCVVGTGYLSRDGHADFAIGAPDIDAGGGTSGEAWLYSGIECPATWNNYGDGWPGTLGVPTFTLSDDPVLCETIDLQVENSRGIKLLAAMFMGLAPAQFPTAWDGKLLVVPLFIMPLTLPAGVVSFPVALPCDTLLCGLTVYLQALELDDGATKGVSFTQGMKLVLGGTTWPW
jgi:FG-GAP repeat